MEVAPLASAGLHGRRPHRVRARRRTKRRRCRMMLMHEQRPLELWGGVEGTVNRVGEEYFEQMQRSGHMQRISDLDAFASLGIKALRQPVLWELIEPGDPADANWAWTDRWLNR